jgi:hypothetical protein
MTIYKQILDGSLPGLGQAYPEMQRSSFFHIIKRTRRRLQAGYEPASDPRTGRKPKDPIAELVEKMKADGTITPDGKFADGWTPEGFADGTWVRPPLVPNRPGHYWDGEKWVWRDRPFDNPPPYKRDGKATTPAPAEDAPEPSSKTQGVIEKLERKLAELEADE